MTTNIKGLSAPTETFDGSPLRVAIVHARWNKTVIDALLSGTIDALKKQGVKEGNIVVQSVPGSFELPLGVSRREPVIAGSHTQASANVTDLLGGLNFSSPKQGNSRTGTPALGQSTSTTSASVPVPSAPFDAIIAIGVLIKGSTMHFEYISDAVSHGLMRIQLDTGVPVIFGVLTALTEEQALERAGLKEGGHNHGEDWGNAAVEMSVKAKRWSEGQFV